MEPYQLTGQAAARAIAAGKLSSEELVQSCLSRIAAREHAVRAWAFLDPDIALEQARSRDRSRAAVGPLHGIPVGIKDIIDTIDMPTACNSAIYRDHLPKSDADCVARLRAAGAVIMGKTKTSEFAHLTPADTANPHDPERTPGGSSSGSAAAVGDCMVPLALGTQTGGSTIRPASYCGAYALKPTYQRIGTRGVKSLAVSFDTVGLIARSIDDLVLLDRVLSARPVPAVRRRDQPLRIGYCETPFWKKAFTSTRRVLHHAAEALAQGGMVVAPVKLSRDFSILNDGFFTICAVEASWALARELREHPKLLSMQFRQFLESGRDMEPDTVQVLRAALLRCTSEIDAVFRNVDVLLTPAAPGEPDLGNGLGNNEFNRIWTSVHLPCLTIPGGVGVHGLPVGIQLVGSRGSDRTLLEIGRQVARIVYG